ncbi:MAG: hypothetical protein K8F27_12140 [Sulfuricellaceae bacterium]|nr:hypothetical protein [Sulfuricellaceae bacterium]
MLLHWRHRSSSRFYTVSLQQDLFGAWVLAQCEGVSGGRLRPSTFRSVASEREGLVELGRITEYREARGYELVDVHFHRS